LHSGQLMRAIPNQSISSMGSSITMASHCSGEAVTMSLDGITWAIQKNSEFRPIFSNVRTASSPW
jgi:hypothetical protein